MPPPIVPAPTTAARLMSAVGVSFGTSGTFAASRSAKNRCRSAFDSVETTQSANSSRSRSEPSSNGSGQAGFDGVDRRRTARARRGGRFERRAHRARTPSRPPRRCVGVDRDVARLAELAGRRARLGERDRAGQQIAVDDRVDDAGGLALSARATGLPSVHIVERQLRRRTSRGSRCVPPAPGMMPSSTSGCPSFASARRDAVVAGHRQLEAAAERVAVNRGDERLGRVLERFSSACVPAERSSDCSRVFSVLKTLMSAPATNVVPGADQHDGVGGRIGDGRARPPASIASHTPGRARSPAGCRWSGRRRGPRCRNERNQA